MAKIRWTEQSVEDLKNIFDYIAKDSINYANHHIFRIREKAKLLTNNPRIGRFVPELESDDIRELIFGNYRIIYRIKSEAEIDILTVHHSARILNLN